MQFNDSRDDLIQEIHELKRKSLIRDNLAAQLVDAIQESFLREKELHAIMNGSKGVLKAKGFAESARSIFDHCKDLIGAASGYVALLSDTGEENEVRFSKPEDCPVTLTRNCPCRSVDCGRRPTMQHLQYYGYCSYF